MDRSARAFVVLVFFGVIMLILSFVLLAMVASSALAAGCAPHLTYGELTVSGARITRVCKDGYAAGHDDDRLIPRWVAYRLTGEQTLGCEKRRNNFHAEPNLPADRRARPSDYAKSGYDKGHMAPAADFSHSEEQMSDSFSMVNMAPQLPGLNRKQWERLEETTRSWAWQRGDVQVYVGPVVDSDASTIGEGKVAVPRAFFKVVVDVVTDEHLAFIMPQRDVPKGKLDPWLVTVDDVEVQSRVVLAMPDQVDRSASTDLWPADVRGWAATKRAACGRK